MARNKHTLPSQRKLRRVKRSVRVLGMGAQLLVCLLIKHKAPGPSIQEVEVQASLIYTRPCLRKQKGKK